jgi:hypothetical protein
MGADGTAVTIDYVTPHRVTLCATNDTAARLEDLQDVLGQGPGPTAYTTGRQVRAHVGMPLDTSLDEGGRHTGGGLGTSRWPALDAEVRAAVGALRVTAVPMRPDGHVWGVITCHQAVSARPNLDERAAQFLGDAVGSALFSDPDRRTTDVEGPWSVRAGVHQATGMVTAQLHIGVDDALALLRAHAFAHSWALAEVAAAVHNRTLDFSNSDVDTDRRPVSRVASAVSSPVRLPKRSREGRPGHDESGHS